MLYKKSRERDRGRERERIPKIYNGLRVRSRKTFACTFTFSGKIMRSPCRGDSKPLPLVAVVCWLFVYVQPVYATFPSCKRIISLAPSITEVLSSLELGNNLIGFTRYDKYQPEGHTLYGRPLAGGIQKVGGFFDPNYELILTLHPSIIFLLTEHADQREKLKQLDLQTVTLNHKSIQGILESIKKVGAYCNKTEAAQLIYEDLIKQIDTVRSRAKNKKQIRTMVVIGAGLRAGSFQDLYLSGKDGFYNEMLTIAGGINVHRGNTLSMPIISAEGIQHLNPKVIFHIVAGEVLNKKTEAEVLQDWSVLSQVEAVKNKRVYLLTEEYMYIPGPRFILALKKIAQLLHPYD